MPKQGGQGRDRQRLAVQHELVEAGAGAQQRAQHAALAGRAVGLGKRDAARVERQRERLQRAGARHERLQMLRGGALQAQAEVLDVRQPRGQVGQVGGGEDVGEVEGAQAGAGGREGAQGGGGVRQGAVGEAEARGRGRWRAVGVGVAGEGDDVEGGALELELLQGREGVGEAGARGGDGAGPVGVRGGELGKGEVK